MAPKPKRGKRKAAPDWRETLFFWRGELRHEQDSSAIVWSGTWVGSSDLELPSALSFAESPNTFELRGQVEMTPRLEWAFREQQAYMLSGLNTSLVGSYLLDGETTKDDEHHLRVATLAPDEEGVPMTTIAAAVGDTPFGRFVSIGTVTREAAVASGAGDSDASEPAKSSARLFLTLARRYVDRGDPRSQLASPSRLPLPALLTSPSALAAPWSALPYKLDAPMPTSVPTGQGSTIDWQVLKPNPGTSDDAWVEGRRTRIQFKASGLWYGLVKNVSSIYEDLPVHSWREANNRPGAVFPNGATMGKRPSYHGSGCEEV
jgi:hypothetical protein